MAAPTVLIRGTFRDSQGQVRANEIVTIEPLDTPFSIGGDVIVSGLQVIKLDANGQFGYAVAYPVVPGTYRVVVSDIDAFGISVPKDGGPYDIHEITVDLGAGDVLRTVVSAGDVGSVLSDTYSIKKTLKTDPNGIRFRLAVIGEGTILPADVLSGLFNTLFPDAVLSLGNANPGGIAATIDTNIGQTFNSYIAGYTGIYGPGATGPNVFFYALGDQDWLPGNVLAVTDFLQLPNNERYYLQAISEYIDLFVLDSRGNEPDGNSANSVQGLWLKDALASSTARFKIVAFRDTFVSSKALYSYPVMNWPFAAWGATMILAAGPRHYERILHTSGIPVIVNGCATNDDTTMDDFGPPVTGSQVRAKIPGIFTIDYNSYSLSCTFLGWDGTVADKFEVFGPDSSKLSLYVNTAPGGGIKVGPDGTKLDFGTGASQALEAGPENWIKLQQGNIIRQETFPTVADITHFPYLGKNLIMSGDDPASLYYWNLANQTWDLLVKGQVPSYWNGSKLKLAPPNFWPASGTITAVTEISHMDPAVEIWYSINGALFTQLTTFPTDGRVYFGQTGNWWIAAYARKAGSLDSEVSWVSYHAPFK